MNWDSVVGVVIGSGIAGVFTTLAQVLSNQRQKKQFAYDYEAKQQQLAHDLSVRQKQFAHEKGQEIRGRRTAALADLQMLMADQASAIQNLWGFLCLPDLHYPKSSAEEAWQVLFRKRYSRNVWPIEGPAIQSLAKYSRKVLELLMFLPQQEGFNALWTGQISATDKETYEAINQKFKEVSGLLNIVSMEVTELTAELNDITYK